MTDDKERIADAFQRHFTHFGFKKTSVDDVARELQISKKTIYQHFGAKEEIFYYIISRIARQYLARMTRDLEACPSVREKIAQLIRLIFAETRKWIKTNDAFEFKYKYEIAELAFRDTYNELFAQLLHEGVAAGELPALPVDLTVRFINGIIAESMRLVNANPELAVEDEVIRAITKLLA